MKNECAKTRDIDNPYEIWKFRDWEWRVLKKYQTPDKEKENPYARWLCAVRSPMTFGGWDIGDVYIKDIMKLATRQEVRGDISSSSRNKPI